MFRQSALMRDKWDRKQAGSTYGIITLQKAIADCKNVYTPKADYNITIGSSDDEPKKMYSFDDMGNAQRMLDMFSTYIRYNYIDKRWLYYDMRRWKVDDRGEI